MHQLSNFSNLTDRIFVLSVHVQNVLSIIEKFIIRSKVYTLYRIDCFSSVVIIFFYSAASSFIRVSRMSSLIQTDLSLISSGAYASP